MSKSLIQHAVEANGPDAVFRSFTPEERVQLKYDWRVWARPEQLEPGTQGASSDRLDWFIWLMLAGRGGGKTKAGAEWVIRFALDHPGCRIALIARTAADVRTTMLEGPSGLLTISPPWFFPEHNPSKAKVTWPNGSVALHFSAEEPKGLRGPQFHAAWCDELAAWPTIKSEDDEPGVPSAWTQLEYGMRLPESRPRVAITTTPKPSKIIRDLIKDPNVVVTSWSTFDNAPNLAPEFIERMRFKFEGTRLGRQELHAEVLSGMGGLWNYDLIEKTRKQSIPPIVRRIVVAVDPSGSAKRTADEAGIAVAALAECNCLGRADLHAFVLEDMTDKLSPRDMGEKAIGAYWKYKADRLVAEDNFGGQIIADLCALIDPRVAYRAVHASRGKLVRAEPVAALYEQGRVHHVGMFKELEDEMCLYHPLTSTESPGRLDAMVWAITDLMLTSPVTLGSDPIGHGKRRSDATGDNEDDDDYPDE